MGSHCAQLSHPPTHWQIFFTHPTLRLLRNRFPVTCHQPRRGPFNALYISSREWPRLPFTARIERTPFHRARSASKKGTWPLPLTPSETALHASAHSPDGCQSSTQNSRRFLQQPPLRRCETPEGGPVRRSSRVASRRFRDERS